MEILGKIIALLTVLIITPIINGFVFAKLWYWLIVPTFQVDEITVAQGFGIMLIYGFINYRKTEDDTEFETFWGILISAIGIVVLTGIIILLFGWIVSKFI